MEHMCFYIPTYLGTYVQNMYLGFAFKSIHKYSILILRIFHTYLKEYSMIDLDGL
jgi:hypothetical protein